MTDSELKELVASLAVAQRETDLKIQATIEATNAQFHETDLKIQATIEATNAQFRETDRKIAAMQERTDAQFRETDRKMAAMQERTDAQFRETDRRIAALLEDTDARFRDTGRKIDQLTGFAGNQWGRMVEALVEPSCLAVFRGRGLDVKQSMRRVRTRLNGSEVEVDVLLTDGSVAVALEVKSTFRVENVAEFLESLIRFREAFPAYAAYTVHGAVAALEYAEDCDRYAARQGLFVLKFQGEVMEIENPPEFRAKRW